MRAWVGEGRGRDRPWKASAGDFGKTVYRAVSAFLPTLRTGSSSASYRTVHAMREETNEARVERLVVEYAQSLPERRPLDARLSLRDDLAIESLSLVSLTVRLGDELGVDVLDSGVELGEVKTLGDLVNVAHALSRLSTSK